MDRVFYDASVASAHRPDAAPDARAVTRRGLGTRALVSLSLTGAALGLLVGSALLWPRLLEAFLRWNALSPPERASLSKGMVAGAACAAIPAAAYLWRAGAAGALRLQRVARVTLPLGLLGAVPSLMVYDFAAASKVTYLVALAAIVVATEWTVRGSLKAMEGPWMLPPVVRLSPRPSSSVWSWGSWLRRALPMLLVGAGALFYAVYFSYFTLLNHWRLGTSAFDLGIHINWSFNALLGFPWRCPVLFGTEGGHFIGNHAIFAMFTWLPLFAIHPGAEVLLIFQATIVGAAAIPLYLFARTQIPRWSAAVIALLYLLYAPLHGPNFYDFHELMPIAFWHFWLYYAIATRKNWLVAIVVPVLYAHREDVAVGVAVVGVFLIATGARPRLGAVLAIVSTVWFVTIKFVVMPRLWDTWFADIYKDLQAPGGQGFAPVVGTTLINPVYFLQTLLKEEKLVYFLHIFVPLAFLPLRRPALLLLAIPGFLVSLMTTGYAPTMSIAFHYTMHWVPLMFGASVLALRAIGAAPGGEGVIRRRAALVAACVGMFLHSFAFGAIFQHHTFVGGFSIVQFKMTPEEKLRYQALKGLVRMIPRDASVAASESEVPHLAARKDAYTLRYAHGDAEYLLIYRSGSFETDIVKEAFARHRYGLVAEGMGIFLFKRDHESRRTAAAKALLGLSQ